MTLSPARLPGAGPTGTSGVRRLAVTLYGYAFLDDFVLLYPVYALLFSDTGLSIWQVSSLFALWSITGIVLEVPSGAWADAVSRRLLLWLGPLLTAVGFALWVIVPSYGAFALGFVLWGVRGALGSGSLEALVYDELDRLGAADRYARVIGRAQAVGMVAVMAAMGLAGPVLDFGGYPAVGAASVLVCVLTAAVATRFPERREKAARSGERVTTLITLRTGLVEARRDRSVRGALLLVPAVGAVWGALDEYTPLLVRDTGVADRTVPLLLLLIYAGPTIGSLLTGVGERLGRAGLGGVLAGSALAMAVGAMAGNPVGVALVGVAFGGFQFVDVLADARLQDRIEGPRRATLTSVASMGTELATVAVFGAYALVAASHAHGTAFALFAVPYLVTALVRVNRRWCG
ncbi:MFS transporter [Streptomyces ipomoeae]|uniref:Transporter, major facilitator family protein n=1 Tax=Streptomyces ipomoeae 91-03 TaxID=698759 RepID=L1KK65_9ACTN|nr:MFS transporter [Streptomyces ipomoeae]EKX60992.1 transporter, major facilitator family protein [Streptomyces ipomoeae 91-03]MDX2695922.1 MFS transporter [Streptomyces ipomoeae]MDX2841743.1 MFS transporter [Streptomyces ipomoeae]